MRTNNIKFVNEPDDPQCPKPVIIEEKNTKNGTDDPLNPAIERTCEFKYYFPSHHDPTKQDGTYNDASAFATAF